MKALTLPIAIAVALAAMPASAANTASVDGGTFHPQSARTIDRSAQATRARRIAIAVAPLQGLDGAVGEVLAGSDGLAPLDEIAIAPAALVQLDELAIAVDALAAAGDVRELGAASMAEALAFAQAEAAPEARTAAHQASSDARHAESRAASAAVAEAAAATRAAATAARAASQADAATRAQWSKEMEGAKAELERAGKRYAELAQKLASQDYERALARPAFSRPAIGIVMEAFGDKAGVRLAGITPGSPADKAGLRSGDVLLRIDGQALDAPGRDARLQQAREVLGELQDGQQVRLAYAREGATAREVTLKATPLASMAFWHSAMPEVRAMPNVQLRKLEKLEKLAELRRFDIGPIAPFANCEDSDGDCLVTPLAEAFRWRGLRLAEVDAKLGRYFGTDHGVLVLSSGEENLPGLEPGDVIVSIDGQAVDDTRGAMRAMRGKSAGEDIDLVFLRDRKTQQRTISAPKLARIPLGVPPAPPAPPAPAVPRAPAAPAAPEAGPMSPPPAPVAPPAPPAPPDERLGVIARVLEG